MCAPRPEASLVTQDVPFFGLACDLKPKSAIDSALPLRTQQHSHTGSKKRTRSIIIPRAVRG